MYVVVSSTGWSETYNRKEADEALEKFLHPLPIGDVLEQFQTMMQLEARNENWGDVIDFIGAITGQSPQLIPEIVGVGFWGRLTMLEHQQGTN